MFHSSDPYRISKKTNKGSVKTRNSTTDSRLLRLFCTCTETAFVAFFEGICNSGATILPPVKVR
jgi:hypothetical protein